jgi:hypothetical protein
LWTLLALVLLLLIFHRPIVHYGGRWAAIWLAKKRHLDVELTIRGNVWSHLEITGVKVRADGTGLAPLEQLDLDRLALDYDMMKLIRGDLTGLGGLDVGTVDVVIPERKEPKPEEESEPLAKTLRGILKKPLPAPRVQIGRVDLRVKNSRGDIVAKNFHLSLLPGTTGVFGWDGLELPGLAPVGPLAATTEYGPGNLRVQRKTGDVTETFFVLVATPAGMAPSKDPVHGLPDTNLAATPTGFIQLNLSLLGFRTGVFVLPAASGNNVHLETALSDLDAQTIVSQLGLKTSSPPPPVRVPSLTVFFDGDPKEPASWQNALELKAFVKEAERAASSPPPAPPSAGTRPRPLELLVGAKVELAATMKNQTLELIDLSASGAGAHFAAKGKVPIPPAVLKGNTAGAITAVENGTLDFTLEVPELATPGKLLNKPLAGKLQGIGKLEVGGATARLTFDLTGDALASPPASVTRTEVKVHATQSLQAPEALRTIEATVDVHLQNAGTKEAQADDVTLAAEFKNLRATLRELKIARGNSTITAMAETKLDERGQIVSPPAGKFSLNVPELADFQLVVKDQAVSGAVTGTGEFVAGQPIEKTTGKVSLRGTGLKLGSTDVGEFEIEANAADGAAKVPRITMRLPGKATVDVKGQLALADPHAYTGKVAVAVPDLSAFKPLLEALGKNIPLAGKISLNVEGNGDVRHPVGTLNLEAKDVEAGDAVVDEARVVAKFTGDAAEVSEFTASVGRLRADAQLQWKDRRAHLSKFEVRLDDTVMLAGTLSAPLDLQGKVPLPQDQPITANFTAKNLDVPVIMGLAGQPASVAGKLSLKLEAGGTLADPTLNLEVHGDKLRTVKAPEAPTEKAKSSTVVQPSPKKGEAAPTELPPTDVEARVTLANKDLKLNGTVKQPLIQPLTFSGNTTLDLKPLLEGKPFDAKALPISAKVDLPASQLAFVPRLVPALAKLDGTAAIDLQAKGTVGKPELNGHTTLDLKLIRMANGAAPLVTNFKGRVAFTGDRVSFEDFGGELGGGKFGVKGTVNIAQPAEPTFDLAVNSKDVLVVRDDTVLVRVDSDVTLKGPLKAATAAGTVTVVNSRFNKEIEILPLALPGRPKPVPKVAAQTTTISFPDPPLRDWKFDIAVKTRTEDPFLVRGNLARGRVMIDVHLAGTGLQPYLTGAVNIEQFSATLPMSTLTTRRGLVTFSQESPFQPYVELEAESRIRQYVVVARVHGPATNPQLDLESEPPLPQQEILSLLTTGSLTGEIGANNSALATRAAVLVVQGWYRKIFKKKAPPEEKKDAEDLLDRFDIDFGAVDPKTGRNETRAQVKLSDRMFLIGELELGGGVSGRVKYLLRFK